MFSSLSLAPDAGVLRFFGIFAFPLSVGILSAFAHCAAMCGPIHLFLARRRSGGLWVYHVGRVITYALIGAAAGGLGLAFGNRFGGGAGWIWVGLYLLIGLKFLGVPLWPASWGERYGRWLTHRLAPLTGASGPGLGRLLLLGLIAGFLPCVTTQAGFAWAAGTESVWQGGAGMLLLGAGTLPLFLAFPRKWFPKGKTFHILLGVGMLLLAAWRTYAMLTGGGHVHDGGCH